MSFLHYEAHAANTQRRKPLRAIFQSPNNQTLRHELANDLLSVVTGPKSEICSSQ